MEANETTALISSPKETTHAKDTRIDVDEWGDSYNEQRHYCIGISLLRRGQIPVLETESKFLVLATATIAIVLFVIMIDISITALRIPDLVFRHNEGN